MDVVAVEGISPGIRPRNRPTQVMLNQKKIKARRKKRKELVLFQICLFGGLLLVVKGFSYLAENSGEDLVYPLGNGMLKGVILGSRLFFTFILFHSQS